VSQRWSLFLDRDGVINELLPMDYVKTWQEFKFKTEVLEELALLSEVFDSIFIVTNQQGVGKGLMTEADLNTIHSRMSDEIHEAGGRITKIYSCIHIKESDCDCRKPKTGMLKQAFADFPDLTKSYCVLVGDSASDIEMAKAFGIMSVGMLHHYNKDGNWTPQPEYIVHNLTELRMKLLPLIL
jgi:D-glycero-D-manno-heptose 1,7-bisphosphate phosphatase